jgi:hypothetical protein
VTYAPEGVYEWDLKFNRKWKKQATEYAEYFEVISKSILTMRKLHPELNHLYQQHYKLFKHEARPSPWRHGHQYCM